MSDVNQARRTRFQCLFDGTDITSDIAPYLLSVTYIDNDDAEGDDLQLQLQDRELILLVNNRADRGSRTEDMLAVCLALNPSQVWLLGAARGYMRRGLIRRRSDILIRTFAGPEELSIDQLAENQVIYAIGNIAQGGRELMSRVRKEGTTLVS